MTLGNQTFVLVLCGGIGHSTQLMHQAVKQHPQYSRIADEVEGKPEARILEAISKKFFQFQTQDSRQRFSEANQQQNVIVLVEDASTNCWLNAKKTQELLDAHGFSSLRSVVVAQDPAMCRRTIAAFENVYAARAEGSPVFSSWPTFVPQVASNVNKARLTEEAEDVKSCLYFANPELDDSRKQGLWSMNRFMSLLLGEIPRMRDDENGYGPRGKGSIIHVDIPEDVENAWRVLSTILGHSGRRD